MLPWLWWLILCVNLTELQDVQFAGWALFMGVSLRYKWKRLIFESMNWTEWNRCFSTDWRNIIQSIIQIEQQGRGRENESSLADCRARISLLFQGWDLEHQLPCFSDFAFGLHNTPGFLESDRVLILIQLSSISAMKLKCFVLFG